MPPVSPFVLRYCAIFSLASAITAFQPVAAQAQTTAGAVSPQQSPAILAQNSGDLRPLAQPGSLLSLEGGRRLMQEADAAVNAQNYDLSEEKLQSARQVFNQVSNFYQDLSTAFQGIESRISKDLREQAVAAAQLRDEATYRLALTHRAKNQPDLAVPLLVQIIRSQNPTQDLGKRAYQQLFELGFVNTQFPRP